MKDKKKVIILASIIVGVLVVTLGLTYAAITFNETKGNSQLVLGDIWMHYNESDTSINITDLMPNKDYTNDYFEFTIDGKNTYDKKDIWYEIVLSHGDYTGDDTTRTIRIDDGLLKFKLVEVVDGEEVEIFKNRTYSDLTNKRIHVDTISSTDNNYSKTYRLYMRLAEYTNICMGDATDGCDYYINPDSEYANLDWNKLFASIKVNVTGDFEEKSIETPGSCFTYVPVGELYRNENMSEEEINLCVDYVTSLDRSLDDGETYEDFCQGAGTIGGYNFQQWIDGDGYMDRFFYNELAYLYENNIIIANKDSTKAMLTSYDNSCGVDVVIPREIDGYSIDTIYGFEDRQNYEHTIFEYSGVNTIIMQNNIVIIAESAFGFDNGSSLMYVEIPNNVTTIEYDAFSYTGLRSVYIPNSVTTMSTAAFIDNSKLVNLTFEENSNLTIIGESAFRSNQLTSVEIPNSVTTIGDGAFSNNQLTSITFEENSDLTAIGRNAFSDNQLTNVVIPNGVVTIDYEAFSNNQLTSITFEENSDLTTIGSSAFRNNQLTNVVIPNGVVTIDYGAFQNNQLTSVEIPNSVTTIGPLAFNDNQLTSVEIPNSVITIGQNAFSDNQLKNVTIGSGIQYINYSAFFKNSTSNPNLESITFTGKTCSEIKNIPASSSSTTKYFPWLSYTSPYYLEGYKTSIIGTDGECSY